MYGQNFYYGYKDQDKKADAGKPLLFSVPTELVQAVGAVMSFGAGKYGRDTWQGVDADRYQQALARHFEAYKADLEGMDEESGLPHLWHLACNVAFLCHKHGFRGQK